MATEDYCPEDKDFDQKFLEDQHLSIKISIKYNYEDKCFIAYTQNSTGYGKTKQEALNECVSSEMENQYVRWK